MGCAQSSTAKSQPAANPATEVKAFKVTVHRKEDTKLGVELGTTLDGKALLVLDVHPGLVMELNKTHQETQLLAGDSIQSVNGIQANPEAMKADLGSKEILELVVAPFPKVAKSEPTEGEVDKQPSPTMETTVKLDNTKSESLGLKVSTVDGTCLQVLDVLDGFCKSHKEASPEASIRAGDSIVGLQMGEVKVEGDAVKLMTALARMSCGVLTLRRLATEAPAENETEPAESKTETANAKDAAQPADASPVPEPAQQAAEEEKKEEEEVQPIQQPEEPQEAATTPTMVVEAAEVRRGGLFGYCCAPAVVTAVE
mmetsp:Transcript_17501/g.39419  ORF Transcript_17501/g.39419 Transcript_17501/m.39419 type:complete len:313 (-) Transcript_17501:212-1150(-)